MRLALCAAKVALFMVSVDDVSPSYTQHSDYNGAQLGTNKTLQPVYHTRFDAILCQGRYPRNGISLF